MSAYKGITQFSALFAVVVVFGFGFTLQSSSNDSPSLCSDGRINCDAWQTGAVYCDEEGVRVLYSRSGDPQQGQTALYVSSAEIDAHNPNGGESVLIEENLAGYALYALNEGKLQFNAPGLDAGLYTFTFSYPQCVMLSQSNQQAVSGDGSIDSPVNSATPSGPTATPTDTPTAGPSPTPTDTPTAGPSPTPTDTSTPTITATSTDTPTSTVTDVPTETPTDTPTTLPTETPTDTPTATPTDTPTYTPTP